MAFTIMEDNYITQSTASLTDTAYVCHICTANIWYIDRPHDVEMFKKNVIVLNII